ncbi:MAG: ABC transporter substrate-binding protein [Kibdelosporangium sp.]
MSPRYTAAALALALVTTGCATAGSATDPAQAGPPKEGGTLTLGIAFNPDCLDPQQTGVNAALNITRQLVDSLTDQDPRTGEIKPWLARKWTVNDTSTIFTFELTPGATFADGTPVDAAAVRTNFEQIVKLGAKSQLAAGYLAGLKEITAVDAGTLKVEFAQPSTQFLQATSTMSLGLLSPKAYLDTTPERRCQGEGLIGSGPFTFGEFRQNQQVVITKRKGYTWGSSLWSRRGEAYLDKVVYRIIPEPGVRTGALRSNQVDAITDVQPQDEGQFSTGFHRPVRPNPGVAFNLTANTTRPVLAEEKVRQAVQKAVNRQEVVDTVLTSNYKPATSILASTTPLFEDLGDRLRHDPDGARKLLDEAGWVPGGDAIRVKGGQRLAAEVLFASNFNQNQTMLELIQQQLRTIGFELRLKLVTPGESAQLQQAGNFDFTWFNVTRSDPDMLRVLYHPKLRNLSKLPAATALEKQLDLQATDLSRRRTAVSDAQREIVDKAYAIPVFELTQVWAASLKVHGFDFEASSRLQLHDAWVS